MNRCSSRISTCRAQGRIQRPEVIIVEEGLIYAWSKEVRGKLGGQSKIPHIDPTPDGEMIGSLASYAGRADRTGISAP